MTETVLATEHYDSLQLRAYEKVREGILYARYAPGDRLQIKDLCLDVDAGRTPVRESLVRLRQEGLVYAVPQSGTYVSRISLQSIECARYAREHLERQIAIDCCGRIDSAGVDRLVGIIRMQKRALDEGDRRGFFDSDNLLHEVMFDIAGRHRVWSWLERVSFDLQRYRWLRVNTEELDWNDIMDQHYAICDALAERNADEADFLTSAHLHLLFAENSAVLKTFPDYFVNDR